MFTIIKFTEHKKIEFIQMLKERILLLKQFLNIFTVVKFTEKIESECV